MVIESELSIDIPEGGATIIGSLAIPDSPIGVILFAHGSGSSRFSPRNKAVASHLRSAGMATLLIDLLTPKEDANYENRFNIELLAERLDTVAEWVFHNPRLISLPLALFGASTGA